MARKVGDHTRRNNGSTAESRESSLSPEVRTKLPAPLVQELSELLTQILVADIQALPVGVLAVAGRARMPEEQEHDVP